MYFNYKTGIGEKSLDSIGVVSEGLRNFLHANVFDRIPKDAGPQKVKVICHSTGCPIVLQYIANNAFDHGIEKLITVGGAHYGAYWAEPAIWYKSLFPWLSGDKQIHELIYGSYSLFELQSRLHHLLAKRDKPRPTEPGLQGTAFSAFEYVVTEKVDAAFLKEHRKLELPEIVSIVGTDGWNSWSAKRGYPYSDGVIRVESALLDCRFLTNAPREISDLNKPEASNPSEPPSVWNPACENKFVLFLPCAHNDFFRKPCQIVVIALIDYVLHPDVREKRSALASAYEKATKKEKGNGLPDYLRDMNMSALWVNINYDGLPGTNDPADNENFAAAVEKINAEVMTPSKDECAGKPKYVQPPPYGWLDRDYIKAVRTSKVLPERVFYFKYLEAPQELCLKVTVNISDKPLPLTIRQIPQKTPADHMKIKTARGQTTVVSCRRWVHGENQIDCEIVTEAAQKVN